MKPISDIELRALQIQVLDEFARYCKDNQLTYFLAYGTLLGAVRHQGYIPWDDDIDVMMPREDYDKFIHQYNDPNNRYKVTSCYHDKHYPIAYAKIFDNSTVVIEKVNAKYELGVNIDIFPIDGIPTDETKSQRHLNGILKVRRLLGLKLSNVNSSSFIKRVILKVIHAVLSLFNYDFFTKKIDSIAKKYPYSTSLFLACSVYPSSSKERFSKDIFKDIIQLPFEGKSYDAPKRYDELLTIIYGNYMQFPPKEEQIPHHSFEAFYK